MKTYTLKLNPMELWLIEKALTHYDYEEDYIHTREKLIDKIIKINEVL